MRVLVIPEDFRKDQYILQPVVEAMLAAVGRPKAKVIVLRDPLLGGLARALDWKSVESIIDRYQGMVDLFLLMIDRDGDENRRTSLDRMERLARNVSTKVFLAEHAWQEIEIWAIAGHAYPKQWKWSEVRAEKNLKERYFLPLVRQLGLLDEPGEGRRTLGLAAAENYQRVRKRCPEDIRALEERVASAFGR